MKKTKIFSLLIASSFIALNAYAQWTPDEERVGAHASQRAQYQFELVGDIIRPTQGNPQARFRITPQAGGASIEELCTLTNIQTLRFEAYMRAGLLLSHNTPLPETLGAARERVRLDFTYRNQNQTWEGPRPTEYPLQGVWESREDRDHKSNEHTLRLRTKRGENDPSVDVYQDHPIQGIVNHELVCNTGPERPGRLYFDGENAYLGRIVPQLWRNPKNGVEYPYDLVTRDLNAAAHQGNEMAYVEPFSLDQEPLRTRNDYRGEYEFVRALNDQESMQGRETGRLIYSDGNHIYLPHVTQELWRRERARVGFFLASYRQNRRLSFIGGAEIPNGRLPEGLYHLSVVRERQNRRVELWQRLGENGHDVEITSPLRVPSIPGMGVSAHYLVSENSANPNQEIETLMEEIRVREVSTPQLYLHAGESVLIVGPTGSGKSCLFNMLARRGAVAERRTKGMIVDIPDPVPGSSISHNQQTGTEVPVIYFDEQNNRAIIDSPGIGDIRGEAVDIRNAFSLQRVLRDRHNLKIILTLRESLLAERSRAFVDSLNDITSLFSDETQLLRGVSLMVTYHDRANVRGLLTDLVTDLSHPQNDVRRQLSPSSYRLLEFLSRHPERVNTMPYPQREGPYAIEQERLRQGLTNSNFVETPNFRLTVGPNSKTHVQALATRFNEYLTHYMRTEGSRGIIHYCRQLIERNTGTIGELRQRLSRIVESLDNIATNTTGNFIQSLRSYINMDEIQRVVERLNFLRSIREDIAIQLVNWKNAVTTGVRGTIQNLATAPQELVQNGVLYLRGLLVGTSDVQAAVQRHPNLPIRAYAGNTFFVDSNVENRGRDFYAFAPRWEVQGQRTINLNGLDGSVGASGVTPGAHGQPGLPGGNGGHFYGHGFTFLGMNQLVINTNGGRGGTGGNGVRGGDGVPGAPGDKNLVTGTNQIVDRRDNHTKYTERTYYRALGRPGGNGQNGGQAGAGGLGGHSGTASIDGYLLTHTTQDGAAGSSGAPGAGGIGGLQGQDCEGIWIEHYTINNGSRQRVYSFKQWEIPPQHKPLLNVVRGAPGTAGNGLNQTNRQNPPTQNPLDREGITREYNVYFQHQSADPTVALFVRTFPNLNPFN